MRLNAREWARRASTYTMSSTEMFATKTAAAAQVTKATLTDEMVNANRTRWLATYRCNYIFSNDDIGYGYWT